MPKKNEGVYRPARVYDDGANFKTSMQAASPRVCRASVRVSHVTDALDLNDREARLFMLAIHDDVVCAMIDAADDVIYKRALQAGIKQKQYQDIASKG